jgi:hypothetical protein
MLEDVLPSIGGINLYLILPFVLLRYEQGEEVDNGPLQGQIDPRNEGVLDMLEG